MTEVDSVPDPNALRDLILHHAGYERKRLSRAGRTFYRGN
jgi:hypothetical protein